MSFKITSHRELDVLADVPDIPGAQPGDTIEFSLTHEVELPDGMKMWAKFGLTSVITEDEDATSAADRVAVYVMNQIAAKIRTAVAHSTTIA